LGLTQELINAAKSLREENRNKGLNTEVIDCRAYLPPKIDDGFLFRQANWLEWQPDEQCDVVIGDDILCNLGVWQVPMFFESMAHVIKAGGIFIVRTTAVYSPDLMHPTRHEISLRLKHIKEAIEKKPGALDWGLINQSAVYEVAWPLMHSSDFYDEKTCMFDFSKWDEFVKEEFPFDVAFANRLRLPYNVRATSLNYGDLKNMALPWFEIIQEEIPAHSIWESDERYNTLPGAEDIAFSFKQYYRILIFGRRRN